MTKSPYSQHPYYTTGIPDMYMQMGYYPFPTQPAAESIGKDAGIPYAMAMASQCKYFLGQSEKMTAGGGVQGFAALVNPLRSGVQLCVNNWTVTNFSKQPLVTSIWFGKAASIVAAKKSSHLSPGFVQLSPCPSAQGQILFAASPAAEPDREGVIASTRIVPPLTTIDVQKSGGWILSPGTAMMIHVPEDAESGTFVAAMEWWEQQVFG